MSVCLENVGNLSPSPQNELEFSPRSIQGCFPLLQWPRCWTSPSVLLQSNWVKYDYNLRSDRKQMSIRSGIVAQLDRKSADGDFLRLSPWRSGEKLWIDLGGNSKALLGEEDQRLTFSGQTLMRTYGKGAFSTVYKSNCIRICLSGYRHAMPDIYSLHIYRRYMYLSLYGASTGTCTTSIPVSGHFVKFGTT